MSTYTSFGPWANPQLEDGLYTASVMKVRHIQNGADNGPMLELTFELGESALTITSNQYLPKEFSPGCQHRLWYLCQALGLEAYDLIEDPDAAVGRRLVLELTRIHPTAANHGRSYSDVKRFLPFVACDEESMKKTAV